MASIPSTTFDAVARQTAVTLPVKTTGTPLTSNGLPRVVFFGAEFCPYCQPNAWALVLALDRFGSFSRLGLIRSSMTDVYPDTAGFTFHGAEFHSDYLAFTGYEVQSNTPDPSGGYTAMDKPSASDSSLFTAKGQGAYPYLNFGNQFDTQTSFTPALLAGLDQQDIADRLRDPTDKVTMPIIDTANLYTAAICQLTKEKPATVCASKGVVSAVARLNGQ